VLGCDFCLKCILIEMLGGPIVRSRLRKMTRRVNNTKPRANATQRVHVALLGLQKRSSEGILAIKK
jgi:hypothetical protein